VKSSLPGSGAEGDWECISEQSCQENSGNGEAVGRNGKNLSPEYNQTRRKLEQSEVNRTITAKSKEREARKAELKAWRDSGGHSTESEESQGWLEWLASYFK
jgi:hypothetical protein